MQFRKETILKRLAMVAIGGVLLGSQPLRALEYNDPEGAEVLTRGPVHEAFASAVSYNAEAGIIVSSRPPEVIDELPPEQRPTGDNVTWIPGYWGWEEEQNDFLWISGVWRNLPPGRQWVPGYWADAGGSFQWTSGYWQDAEATSVSYLPEPPRSLEVGPNIAAPSDDVTWVSGNWIWNDNSYAWRAGYWAPARQDWIWTPASYRWTHRGHVYVDGYWDYSVARRGVLFAPVRFSRAAYVNPGYYYRPSTVISISVFTDHLFLRPNYCHYYFGDYYAPRYRDHGYYASYSYHSSRRGFDPIYYHNRWEHRHDRGWERGRREYFEYRRDNEGSRPARTWASFNARPERERGMMAQRYDRFIGSRRGDGQRFQAVAPQERERIVSQRQEMRNFSRERQDREIRGNRPERGQVARAESRRSPVVGRVSSRGADAPPKRLEGNRQGTRQDGDRQQQASRPDRQGEGRKGRENPAMANRDNNIARPNRESGGRETANRGTAERPKAERGNGSRGNVTRPNQDERNRSADRGNGGQARDNAVAPPVRKVQPERKRETAVSPPVRKQESPRQSAPRAGRQGQPQRQATPQRQSVPQPQRQYKPQNKAEQKRVAPPAVRQTPPARQAQPQRKAQPQPQRKAQPQPQRQAQPQRQPQRQAAPARPQQSQQRVQPQRAPQQRAQQQPRARQQQHVQPRQSQARPAPKPEAKKGQRREAKRESI